MRRNRKGSAVVEAALMMPWIAFLFVGVLDSGFYTYAAMATQNAAREVAIQDATLGGTMTSGAMCTTVKNEMGFLPNVGVVGTCAATQAAVNSTFPNPKPMWVCAGTLNNVAASVCGLPAATCADCGITPTATSVQAVVTYESIPLVPIPGILTGQLQLTRIAEARIIQ